MAQNYFSIVTNIGRNKLALSAAGGAAVTITHFAIGDGNGAEVNPTAASTALVREVWRTPVESVVIDPLNPSAVLVTSIIPTAAGGWWMREFGIFDVDGDMVAVAKPVSQYKPTALEGQLEDIRYEFQIIIGETANVTMLVDPSVLLASRDFVEKRKVPVAQLSLTPWVPVKSMTVTAPPANPTAWDTYIIPAGATGAWAGNTQKLAEWNGVAWNIVTPPDGHGIGLPDGRVYERVGGTYIEKLALDTQSGKWAFAVAGGSANALTITLAPVPSAYPRVLYVRFSADNTAAATIKVNGLAAVSIKRYGGSEIRSGDIVGGGVGVMFFNDADSTYQMVSLPAPGGGAISYTAVGTYTFVVPQGITQLKRIRVWGSGGGGGGSDTTNSYVGGGAGAGAYGEIASAVSVVPGSSIAITVGAGGVGGTGSGNGTAGSASSVGSIITAPGGGGGYGNASALTPSGGAAPTTGDIRLEGERGYNGNPSAPTSGIGGASPFGGGVSVITAVSNGGPGHSPGGGGGGAGKYTSSLSGGAGAPGMVIIEY